MKRMKMKIFLMGLLLAIVGMTATGCSSCQSANTKQGDAGIQPVEDVSAQLATAKAVLGDFTVVPFTSNAGELVPEHVMATDREWTYLNAGDGYDWFETEVVYAEKFNSPEQSRTIARIRNIFQKATPAGKGYDVKVYYAITTKEGTVYQPKDAFWVEDLPLNEVKVNLTFKDAYDRLMAANITKPDGCYCVLRKPVGPNVDQHPLYIFGNKRAGLVFVDAVTGEVSAYLGGPLGEWP